MNYVSINGELAYNRDSMIDMLHGFGMDDSDIDTMNEFLNADELADAHDTASVYKQEYEALEARADEVQAALNEVLNLIDEALDMGRITKARERMEAMRRVIVNA